MSLDRLKDLFNTEEQKKSFSTLLPLLEKRFSKLKNQTKYVYQVIGDILQGKPTEEIKKNIMTKKIGWKHPNYNNIQNLINEHDEYMLHPFDVADGVIQCPRCKSMKTFSNQLQCRSGDEMMTTFSKCVICNYEWTYSG